MNPHAEPPPDEFLPASDAELGRFVASATQPLYPVGGRTSRNVGRPAGAEGVTVSTSKLARLVDYAARDMTVTVEAGIRIDELAATLAGERQQLPVDVPQSRRATLGGVLATNTSGSRRYGYGTLRDYLIGVTAVDGAGRVFHAGGRVVKNVAGYDLCKLLIGSRGTLGVVVRATLKLRPLPEQRRFLWAAFSALADVDAALDRLTVSETRPVVLDVLHARSATDVSNASVRDLPGNGPVLVVGFEGTEAETRWQVDTLQDELRSFQPAEIVEIAQEDAGKLLDALTEFSTPSDDPLVFQGTLRPSRTLAFVAAAADAGCAVHARAGNGVVSGYLPEDLTEPERGGELLARLAEHAREASGHLRVLDCDPAWNAQAPSPVVDEQDRRLSRRLREALDPRGLLNPHVDPLA